MNHTTSLAKRQSIFGSHIITMAVVGFVLIIFQSSTAQAQWATNGSNINNTNTGNVGIGTTTPGYKLVVAAPVTPQINLDFTDAASATQLLLSQSGVNKGFFDYVGPDFSYSPIANTVRAGSFGNTPFDLFTNSANRMRIDPSGNVGIGTTAPAYKLDVNGAVAAKASSTAFVRLDPNWNNGQIKIQGDTTGSISAPAFLTGGYAYNGAALSVNSYYNPGNNIWAPPADTTSSTWALIMNSCNGGQCGYGGDHLEISRGPATTGSPTMSSLFYITSAGNVGIGTTLPTSKLHVVGDVTVTGNIAAKYQDVAEWVPSTHALSAGTVVIVDPSKSNHVMSSSHAYDTRVAGVISAQPGLTLGEGGEGKVLVATTGRVRIRVDATRTPVRIGDLLVTSDNEGMAMKSEPLKVGGRLMHMPGTLIGKALEPLAKGTGEILVLLSLQ